MTNTSSSTPVTNFLWRGEQRLDDIDLVGTGQVPSSLRGVSGHFACHQTTPEQEHVLVRDPLGVNKLFFAIGADGHVDSSNYIIDLVRGGHRLRDVWSVPSGHVLRVSPHRRTLTLDKYSTLTFQQDAPRSGDEWKTRASAVRERLTSTFRALKPVVAGRPVYVTMSGGLDSTVMAVLARSILGDVRGVTFCIDPAGSEATGESEDAQHARRVAEVLGIELEVLSVPTDAVVEHLDVVLRYGQDWRDFNVHCGLVNAAIGAALAERHRESEGTARPVVITGDGMNELMADYSPVVYAGEEYYTLPRMPAGRLRRFLVGGLDAGDREVGIFAHFGLDTVQPYLLCADAYTALPAAYLDEERIKQRFVESVMGEQVPAFVLDRPKVRAQVASAEQVGGTLGLLADRGWTSERLAARFANVFEAEAADLEGFIRGGFYRFPTAFPERA